MKTIHAILLVMFAFVASGAQSITNVFTGTTTNDGTGDALTVAFRKLNTNDTWLLLSINTATNGLATTNYVNQATNDLYSTLNALITAVEADTNGVTAAQATNIAAYQAQLSTNSLYTVVATKAGTNSPSIWSPTIYGTLEITEAINFDPMIVSNYGGFLLFTDDSGQVAVGAGVLYGDGSGLSNVYAAAVSGYLTNAVAYALSSSNAAWATNAAYVSTATLTNNLSGNAATATVAEYVTKTLTNSITGSARWVTGNDQPLTNAVVATNSLAHTNLVNTKQYGHSTLTNLSGIVTNQLLFTNSALNGALLVGTITNNTTGRSDSADSAVAADYVLQSPLTNSIVATNELAHTNLVAARQYGHLTLTNLSGVVTNQIAFTNQLPTVTATGDINVSPSLVGTRTNYAITLNGTISSDTTGKADTADSALYANTAGTVSDISGNSSQVTGITSNQMATATDEAYRFDTITRINQSSSITVSSNTSPGYITYSLSLDWPITLAASVQYDQGATYHPLVLYYDAGDVGFWEAPEVSISDAGVWTGTWAGDGNGLTNLTGITSNNIASGTDTVYRQTGHYVKAGSNITLTTNVNEVTIAADTGGSSAETFNQTHQSTDATAYTIYSVDCGSGDVVMLDFDVVARGPSSTYYLAKFVVAQNGATTVVSDAVYPNYEGSLTTQVVYESSTLKVKVAGISSETINWRAQGRMTKVSQP